MVILVCQEGSETSIPECILDVCKYVNEPTVTFGFFCCGGGGGHRSFWSKII